ncbi:MAG: tyrosine-type recombinase/integrase [Thermoplasmatota archaeon]
MSLNMSNKSIEKAKENLKNNDDLIEENKEAILGFDRELELNDFSKARRYKYLTRLPKMGAKLDKPFKETEREDIERIILWIKRRTDINSTTKNDYKILLKRFYRWIGEGKYPECIEWLEINDKNNNDKLPEEMLTEEDIEELIDNALNPRDKALISILWETGARIGELIDLTVGSIEDHKHGFKVVVDGKTGSRRLPLIGSVPYINQWLEEHPKLEEHPDSKNKEAPLWVNIGKGSNTDIGDEMSYRAIRKMLKSVKNRSDVDKPVNPHQFRHSRATYLASRFTEAQMCEFFGWVQGSSVPGRYTHLSGRDIDNAYNKLYGIEEEEDHKEAKLTPKECPRCNEKNPPKAKYCNRCGMALTIEASQQIEEDTLDATQNIEKFKEEIPDLKKYIEEEIKNRVDKKLKDME